MEWPEAINPLFEGSGADSNARPTFSAPLMRGASSGAGKKAWTVTAQARAVPQLPAQEPTVNSRQSDESGVHEIGGCQGTGSSRRNDGQQAVASGRPTIEAHLSIEGVHKDAT